jgi:hypothetical protein
MMSTFTAVKVDSAAWLEFKRVRNNSIAHKPECKANRDFRDSAFVAYHRVLKDICDVTRSADERAEAGNARAQLARLRSATVGSLIAVSVERVIDTVDTTSWSDRVLGQLTRSQADMFVDLVSTMIEDTQDGLDSPVRCVHDQHHWFTMMRLNLFCLFGLYLQVL